MGVLSYILVSEELDKAPSSNDSLWNHTTQKTTFHRHPTRMTRTAAMQTALPT